MKTTSAQISDLYAFTKNHFVDYYDLQTELVDHLANDIEQLRSESPALTFEQARDIAFKKFGIFGFSDIVEQRQKAMNKRYFKYIWREFKLWFSVPKIVLTLIIAQLFYIIFTTSISKYVFIGFYLFLIVWAIYKTMTLNRKYRRRKERSHKKWLLEDIIFKQAAGLNFVFISQIYNVILYSESIAENLFTLVLFSVLCTIAVLLFYISYHLLPDKSENLLKETYPEFSL